MRTTSAVSFAATSRGVPAGANIPIHNAISYPGSDSATAGKSGIAAARFGVVTASALTRPDADRLALYIAPKLLGSDALPAFAFPGPARADAATALAVTRTARLGADLLVEADVL